MITIGISEEEEEEEVELKKPKLVQKRKPTRKVEMMKKGIEQEIGRSQKCIDPHF